VLLLVFYLEAVRIKHAKIAVLCLMIMTTISVVPLQEPLSNSVYFVNVGQGDSIIIKNRTHTVMIDTGGYKSFDMAEETLIPFMAKKKITHLDALILTHDDFDHSGAKDSLMQNFRVDNLLTEKNQFPYKVGDLNINNLNYYNFDEANDNSLVLSLDFMGKKFLFMGDASVKTEEKILEKYNVDCDILKVGHHGSNTSTSEKFLKATSPDEAIISCGAKNKFGHPHEEIIERLKKYNVKIRRTDEEGTICYFSLRS
jgi:competence protein ComEC